MTYLNLKISRYFQMINFINLTKSPERELSLSCIILLRNTIYHLNRGLILLLLFKSFSFFSFFLSKLFMKFSFFSFMCCIRFCFQFIWMFNLNLICKESLLYDILLISVALFCCCFSNPCNLMERCKCYPIFASLLPLAEYYFP